MVSLKRVNFHIYYMKLLYNDDMPQMTTKSWTERLIELTVGYRLKDQWNMEELGLFFNSLLDRDLVEKTKQSNGGKKSKQRLTAAFFVVDGSKATEPIVI